MATSSAAFKEFRSRGVVVFTDSKKEFTQLPAGAKAVRKKSGNTIPMVFVTTADGETGIKGISYDVLKKDTRQVARDLREELESYENILGNPATEEDDDEVDMVEVKPVLLAEPKDWTNTDGVTICASVKEINGTNVIFIMNDKEIPYAISKLSPESKQSLKALLDK